MGGLRHPVIRRRERDEAVNNYSTKKLKRWPERFWEKVEEDPETGCWEWRAGKTHGYGITSLGRDSRGAHRIAYELVVGLLPDGLTLDHLCRNRGCVNPAHLEPVTNRENVLRGVGIPAEFAKRTHCSKGHPFTADNLMPPKPYRHGRHCRICYQAHKRRSYERIKAREAA